MDFVYLRTFCEVAKWGNFTRAAEALGYAQSSVTTQIQRLEEQYETVLFERFGRRMRPTHSGEVLLSYARQILALQAEAKAQLSEQQAGTMTIGTIETLAAFYLPAILQAFRARYPKTTIVLQAGDEAWVVQAVKDGQCDLGLILDEISMDPELVSVPLRKEEFVIVTRPNSPYGQVSDITVEDMAHERFILTDEGCTYRDMLLQALRQAGIPFQIVGAFSSLEAIKQCVMCGLGIAFLPRVAVQDEVAQGKLRAIAFTPANSLYTQAIYLERKWRSRPFQDLLDTMGHEVVSERLRGAHPEQFVAHPSSSS